MGKLQIVGLGPGDAGLITQSAWLTMKNADRLLLRTEIHPTVAALQEAGIAYEALDRFYEKGQTFEDVYGHIVDYVLQACQQTDVVYVVPGSPVVAENTVSMLIEQGPTAGVEVTVLPGMSFLEVLYTRLHMDPVNGVMIIDSSDVTALPDDIKVPVIITQVYDQRVASDVKLNLMERYGDEYEAVFVYHVSLPDEEIRSVKLYELDRQEKIDHLTSLVLPTVPEQVVPINLDSLSEVMTELLSDHGCPWDKSQTHRTLRRYLLEEVYEMLDAIDEADYEGIKEELGDILYQIVFHCQLAEKHGIFATQDVVEAVSDKMRRRHPHVFLQKGLEKTAMNMVNWDRLKEEEKRQQHEHVMDGVLKGLPSLLQAYKLQEKAAKVGFEWNSDSDVRQKVAEEWQEFNDSLLEKDPVHIEEEAGDVLFVLANLFRRYNIEPEGALHRANSKFRRRFSFVEDCVKASRKTWQEFTLSELDSFWKEAKENEKKNLL